MKGQNRLRQPIDLQRHRLLHVIGFRDDWLQWLKAARIAGKVEPDKGMQFDTAWLAIEQARRGDGIAMGRTCYVADLIASRQLVVPFELAVETEEACYLVLREGRRESPAAQIFRNWIMEEAECLRKPPGRHRKKTGHH